MKLTAFFQRFQTEERVLCLNKTKSTGENAFNGDHLRTEGNHESSNDKKSLFGYFCRFVTRALTLRRRNRIYTFFKHFLIFAIFEPVPADFGS